ncbi:plasmid mobilization protein [Mesomycoplasma molare]|uniref:Antitoxin n=1 Tax=Mesomycoplasma molare TaxID=171288 RepID=A0ABY5TU06_9BACT|nr:hypothetical protein [Mesomycoplasma molare]UWD34065.1 hypothetical protein NX772_03085 [Mesomycoplasma molare]
MYDTYYTYKKMKGMKSKMTVRKTITLSEEDYDLIKINAQERGQSFSEFLRESTLIRIREDDKLDLAQYLEKYIGPIDEEEEKEYEELYASGKLDISDEEIERIKKENGL